MATKRKTTQDPFRHLEKFLSQNPDFSSPNSDSPNQSDSMNWKGLSRVKQKVLEQLVMYQRLGKVIPGDSHDIQMRLLTDGLHSALQIAAMPNKVFYQKYAEAFGHDMNVMKATYQRALSIRSKVLIQFMNQQQHQEPHLKQSILKR